MSPIIMCRSGIFLFVVCFVLFKEANSVPSKIISSKDDSKELVVEVPLGETVTLLCRSNDEHHNFFYWHLIDQNTIVGPSNEYDPGKFKYEVLSGNLTVKAVSKAEEGLYNCVSRGVMKNDINIRSVRMIVEGGWEEVYEHDPNVHMFRAVIVIATLMVISGVGYVGYRIWKNRYRQPSFLVPSEDEEEDSGDELFRAPGVSRGAENMVKTNSTDSFDAPGISTDFKKLLDTASNK